MLALTHALVIDGTGAEPRRDMTLVMPDCRIAALEPSGHAGVPPDAVVIDAGGKTLLPGFVMVHEHLFYPTGPGQVPTFANDRFPVGLVAAVDGPDGALM